jgi:lysophospholipase L1-like esterase
MKNWISFGMALMLLLTAAGCHAVDNVSSTEPSAQSATAETTESGNKSPTTAYTMNSALEQEVSELMNNADLTDSLYQTSLVSEGNRARIAKVMQKAKNGEPITVGFIGGSITAGTAATTSKSAYATLVSTWWKYKFPQSQITFVNAGIGATGSIIGVHRVQSDLLVKKPAFVVVEYAVNDGDDMLTQEAYESLIRRILQSENSPGVLLLFMIREDGSNAQSIHKAVGNLYKLPMISYGDAVTAALAAKSFVWNDIAADKEHPNDRGHQFAASMIVRFLSETYDNLSGLDQTVPSLPDAMTDNRYMEAKLLTNKDITPDSFGGWEASNNTFWAFKNGWLAKTKNSALKFKVQAKEVNILFKKTNSGKGGRAKVYVDGMYVETLDSNFSKGWGEFAASYRVLSEKTKAEHTIEFVYIDEKASDSDGTEFALLGIMVS